MKYLLGITVLMLLSFSVLAEDTLKFSSNSWATEVNVNLLNGQVSLNNSLNQVKVRRFVSNNLAYRVSFILADRYEKNKDVQNYDYNPFEYEITRNTFEANICIGFENHFKGTRRLSPYIGLDLGFFYKTSNQKNKQNYFETEINGAWVTYSIYQGPSGIYYISQISEQGYSAIGVSVSSGVDFYVTKNLFIGIEFQYGIKYKKLHKVEYSESYNSSPYLKGYELNFGPNVINGLRVGYVF